MAVVVCMVPMLPVATANANDSRSPDAHGHRALRPACTIVGTSAGDNLDGTSGDDVICGKGGSDSIEGKGGDDIVYAGTGGMASMAVAEVTS